VISRHLMVTFSDGRRKYDVRGSKYVRIVGYRIYRRSLSHSRHRSSQQAAAGGRQGHSLSPLSQLKPACSIQSNHFIIIMPTMHHTTVSTSDSILPIVCSMVPPLSLTQTISHLSPPIALKRARFDLQAVSYPVRGLREFWNGNLL
jgi:hypothetical protein